MTDKEKAKAYDKAIMVAKNCLEKGTNPANNPLDYFIDCVCKMFPDSFPELCESKKYEKDKKMLEVISYKISQHQGNDERSLFTPDEAEFINEMEDKLKSIRPSWKPSEEQIGALNYAYCELFKREDVGHNILSPLQELIDDLKKL